MGCGCGGSKKAGAATGSSGGRLVGPAAPGYTWNGPQTRTEPKAASPQPRPRSRP